MASGMMYKVHRLEAPLSPLSGYENSDSFKVYLSDTGLLTHMCGLHYRNPLLRTQFQMAGPALLDPTLRRLVYLMLRSA